MTVIKFTASLVATSTRYRIPTLGYVSVGQLAEFMAQQEYRIAAGTLELARPIQDDQSLEAIDFRTGDRLVVFTQPAQGAELFTPLRPGDKILRFFLRDLEITTRGKKSLLIGKSDEQRQIFPDVDLRAVVPDHALDFVSRQSVQLKFDDDSQVWYAMRVGQTRVMLDDTDIGSEPVALHTDHWLRFYRAHEAANASRPIGEIRLTTEVVQDAGNTLPSGGVSVQVNVGIERNLQTLRASTTLPLGQIGTNLLRYMNSNESNTAPVSAMQMTLMRVLPPQTRVSALKPGDYLYAALNLRPESKRMIGG